MVSEVNKENFSKQRSPRQLAYLALRSIHAGTFADVALDRALANASKVSNNSSSSLNPGAKILKDSDRRLLTELVYGCIRRQRTLDFAIDQFARKPARQQPPDLRTLLHLGLYQLRYLSHIPASAAVDTTVELAKNNGLQGLAGFVNGLLRRYARQAEIQEEPLTWPNDRSQRLAIQHSYPDWIVEVWQSQLPDAEVEQLCQWFNQSPTIDLRINPLRTSIEQVETVLTEFGLEVQRLPNLPQGLRLTSRIGPIQQLPGFAEGWWVVQDSSAQLVSHMLDPQPGETLIDACAAPGGKTTHIAELMGDRGIIWACDRTPSRLRKLEQNIQRLQLNTIQTRTGDSRDLKAFAGKADRVLLDVPCSGLGTLHRHADARWRQTPDTVQNLSTLQRELLNQAATWVKPGGVLVYATCTLHPQENEAVVQTFLQHHSQWNIQAPESNFLANEVKKPDHWVKIWPHHWDQDGFFIAKLFKSRDCDVQSVP